MNCDMNTWMIAKDIIYTVLILAFTGALVWFARRQSNIYKQQKEIQKSQYKLSLFDLRYNLYKQVIDYCNDFIRQEITEDKYIAKKIEFVQIKTKIKLVFNDELSSDFGTLEPLIKDLILNVGDKQDKLTDDLLNIQNRGIEIRDNLEIKMLSYLKIKDENEL